jgi:IclR family pca regulon transcriptional regulator
VTTGEKQRDSDYVQSLDRGLSVIRSFGPHHAEQTLSEVARRTDLTRAAARRFLLTLVRIGYMQTDGKVFRLTPRVLNLGYAYLSGLSLSALAAPHLEDLVREVRESSSMAVLDDTDVVYVARVPTARIMAVDIQVGTRFPAHVTSMGRVLLAALPDARLDEVLSTASLTAYTASTLTDPAALRKVIEQVRSRGYALVVGELEEGLISVAAPVRDRQGETVAAVNVSSLVTRTTRKKMETAMLPRLLSCVQDIELDLAKP